MAMRVECPDYNVQPAIDQGILYQEGQCPATDPRLLWNYTDGILSVDGKIAASGSIATSADLEGSFLSTKALGTGSFNFTPPSGYGGLLYRGGSVFYYWDNSLNAWTELDFTAHVPTATRIIAGPGLIGGGPLTSDVTLAVDPNYGFVDVHHNGAFVSNRPIINFNDSVSVSWGISSNGNVSVTAFGTGGGAWLADVNANNHSINALNSINGIPVSFFLTNPFNRDVNANNFALTGIGTASINGNLSVGGEIFYQGQPLEDFIAGGGVWSVNADGSIFRNSNVAINGTNTPLIVSSSTASNFMYLNVTGAAPTWNAYAVQFAGVYYGELGWSLTTLELWTKNSLMFRGFDSTGAVYFPGSIGIGIQAPAQKLDIVGNANVSGCYFVNGLSFACNNGSGGTNVTAANVTATNVIANSAYYLGGILFAAGGGGGLNLSNIISINGNPGIGQTPWAQNIDGGGHNLSNVGSISATGGVFGASGLNVTGNVNTNGCYYIGSTLFACNNGSGGLVLSNVVTINGAPPGGGGGSTYNGPSNGPGPSGPRQLNLNFQNTTGKPIWVAVSILFEGAGSAVAYVGYTSPATVEAAYVDTGSGAQGGSYILNFVVLPNMWYRVLDNTGVLGIDVWSEWW